MAFGETARPTVFVSYCREDEDWKDQLVNHLGVLETEGLLDIWVDTRIGVGEDWYTEIENALNQCSVAILLITIDFLNSRFIRTKEIPILLKRRANEGLRVYPVICKPCAWKRKGWLVQMQVRPQNVKPLSAGNVHRRNTELAAITDEVADIIDQMIQLPTLDGERIVENFPEPIAEALRRQLGLEAGESISASQLHRLTTLNLSRTQVKDDDLASLKGLDDLEILNLGGTNVTDEGLVYLKALSGLRELYLWHTRVKDSGLRHLEGLGKLQVLNLAHAQGITGAGLEHLQNLRGLVKLDLWHTNVSDEGLKHLNGLTALRDLSLGQTKVTSLDYS